MSAEVETERTENAYDFRAQEAKWRPYWEKTGVYKPTGNAPNGRLSTTVPPVHIAITGIEKVVA
ncbi:MAG: LUD domain-containing protein, partial [Rothia aeria]